MQFVGTDKIGNTYTKPSKKATKSKEANVKLPPYLRKKVLHLMRLGYTDNQIKEELQDMNEPLVKTFKARTLEYIRRHYKESIIPEQAG